MKRALVLLVLVGCGGPLAGVSLQSGSESQRRALMSLTFPAIDRTDGVMRRWKGAEPEASTVRDLLFALYGVDAASAAQVATDRPVGISVARVDLPGPKGPEPTAVNAMAFALRESVSTEAWLEGLGTMKDRSGPLALVTQSVRVAIEGSSTPMYSWRQTGRLYFHLDGNHLILSSTLEGLTVAGPAARAARVAAEGDLVIKAYPQVWARQRVKDLARQLAGFLDFLRRGSAADQPSRTAGILAATNAYYYLQPFAAAEEADFTLQVTAAGAELQVRTTMPGVAPSVRNVPSSRIRWSTVMLKLFRIRKPPTNRATPEKK